MREYRRKSSSVRYNFPSCRGSASFLPPSSRFLWPSGGLLPLRSGATATLGLFPRFVFSARSCFPCPTVANFLSLPSVRPFLTLSFSPFFFCLLDTFISILHYVFPKSYLGIYLFLKLYTLRSLNVHSRSYALYYSLYYSFLHLCTYLLCIYLSLYLGLAVGL